MNNYGIIVQARTGSTRLPRKMVLPFVDGKSLLEIILTRFRSNYRVILATTVHPNDDVLAEQAMSCGVEVFRGSEEDVLSRFIGAAEKYGIQKIIRLCADNPFVHLDLLNTLVDKAEEQMDYVSFILPNGKPTILGHAGLFCELTTLDTLKEVERATTDPFFREHVTNYIYSYPEDFKIQMIELPDELNFDEEVRLTVDTIDDFKNTQELYTRFGELDSLEEINEMFNYIRDSRQLRESMLQAIKENTK
jgi:spore coat polysaccharide biosynthesis protein SpsF (cytidylyltransferase family)